jgi:hypothetical protein
MVAKLELGIGDMNVQQIERSQRELELDETLAATFPCSDPLSSNPYTPLDSQHAG